MKKEQDQEQKDMKRKRGTRKRNQTQFFFEQAVKELEDAQMGQKRRKLDAYSDSDDTELDASVKGKKEAKGPVQSKFRCVEPVAKFRSAGGNQGQTRIILWLQNDLRLHDNYVMNWAMQHGSKSKEIIPVYCFDPRYYDKEQSQTEYGTRKTGLVRARFQIESVEALRKNLESIGSGLLVAFEKPEEFIPKLLDQSKHNVVVFQQEITDEETKIEEALMKKLQEQATKKKVSLEMLSVWGLTLHHLDDLDYNPKEYLPHIYGKFRERGAQVKVRPLLPTPRKGDLPLVAKPSKLEAAAANYIPSLADFGFSKQEIGVKPDKRACYVFVGGEESGLKRMNEYIFERKSVAHYNETRNQLLGSEYSSKLSPWFANGSLSPRQVYHATHEFMKKHRSNESTKVFIDELFWRDYNKYWFMRYATKAFSEYGIYDREYYAWKTDPEIVERWRQGQTGMPMIDALMREMNHTGFMPNRGRMIVACYLTQDLKQDWRYGAHHFQEMLIDHDVSSNYGGWNFSSGIGPGRVLVFNSLKQSKDFDAAGKYIKKWCPELKEIQSDYIHDPWNMPKSLQNSTGVHIGKDYPMVINCLKYTNPEVAKKQKRDQVQARQQAKLNFAAQERKATPSQKKHKLLKEKKEAQLSMNAMIEALEKHKKK